MSAGVVVHYHEIGLKGRNRGFFERQLVTNVERSVRNIDGTKVEMLNGRLLVHSDAASEVSGQELGTAVSKTFGVAFCAPCLVVPTEVKAMTGAALQLLAERDFQTFALSTRRSTKEFELTSQDINIKIGAAIQAATGAGVNLSAPDVTVRIEVVGGRSFVYAGKIEGPGGLPVGSSGKVVSLLSGGIDSPVATFRMLKRGAKAILVHFHSAPFTDNSSPRKAKELAQAIAQRQGTTTLYTIAIGDAQQQIVVSAPQELRVVLYRRLMMRIAQLVARKHTAKALVTGDSLGQVASQTLENIACVDDVATMPVFRPLIGVDKREIVEEAQAYGTYETSILPFEDCCSLFVPRSPATRAKIDDCAKAEADLDVDAMAMNCLSGAEIERIIL